MKIDIAVFRQCKHPGRDNAAITHHDNRLCDYLFQERAKLGVVLDFFRLLHPQFVPLGTLLHRGRSECETTTLRSVRLRDHERDGVPARDQRFECRNRELRRPAEDELHLGRC